MRYESALSLNGHCKSCMRIDRVPACLSWFEIRDSRVEAAGAEKLDVKLENYADGIGLYI